MHNVFPTNPEQKLKELGQDQNSSQRSVYGTYCAYSIIYVLDINEEAYFNEQKGQLQ